MASLVAFLYHHQQLIALSTADSEAATELVMVNRSAGLVARIERHQIAVIIDSYANHQSHPISLDLM